MRKTNKLICSITAIAGMLTSSVLVMAQDPGVSMRQNVKIVNGAARTQESGTQQQEGQPPQPPKQILDTVTYDAGFAYGRIISSEASFDTQVIAGSPFSAIAVSESVQVLADGNRIVHSSSSSIYRDSQGRTRREQGVANVGNPSDSFQAISINDPVVGYTYMLDSRQRIAQKMPTLKNMKVMIDSAEPGMGLPSTDFIRTTAPQPNTMPPGVPGEAGVMRQRVGPSMQPVPSAGVSVGGRAGVYSTSQSSASPRVGQKIEAGVMGAKPETVSLGKQTIEGVEAEGTKTTITIAAGQIGNEQPIVIETENWFSQDLHQVVMTRHSDPRFGETTYKLTNINRSEPDRSLFEVPSDYTIKEPTPFRPMRATKKPDDDKQQQQ